MFVIFPCVSYHSAIFGQSRHEACNVVANLFSEVHSTKDRIGSVKTAGDVYPLAGYVSKLADDDVNSGSVWSASLSGNDPEFNEYKMLVDNHSNAVPHDVATSPRSGRTVGESFVATYKDDFTEVSESFLVDRSTDHPKSLSRRQSQL